MSTALSLRVHLRSLLTIWVLLWALAAPAAAEQVRLAWDANTEPDLAGYVVLVGSASRVYTRSVDIASQTAEATVTGLLPGTTYYFAVRAYNASGLQSGLSNEVVVTMPGTAPTPQTPPPPPASAGPVVTAVTPLSGPVGGGTPVTLTGSQFANGATVWFGTTPAVVTAASATALSVIAPARPLGSAVVSVRNPDGRVGAAPSAYLYHSGEDLGEDEEPADAFVRHFAEGVQSAFFSTRFALANPHPHAVGVRLVLTDVFGGETTVPVDVPAGSRVTLDRQTLPALASEAFGSRFESTHPIGIDRTVVWDSAVGYGSHSETGIEAPGTSWFLAEGATHSGFDLFYLLQNSTDETAEVRVRYLMGGGGVIEKHHVVAPRARTNIWVNKDDPALASAEMSAHLESTNGVPIVVERSMYLSTQGQLFTAGHNSAALAEASTRWFLAEGSTGAYFDTFVLVANPEPVPAQLRVTYLLANAEPVERLHTVPANSRYTIWVDQEDARLASTAVSTVVEVVNDVPVIVERAMWWPGQVGGRWTEAHNSAGATSTASSWVLADGEASASAWTYVLVANTGASDTAVRFTLLDAAGSGRSETVVVKGQQRYSVDVADMFAEARQARFGVLVESLDGAPLVVERATYANAAGTRWAAGTNSLGTPLP